MTATNGAFDETHGGPNEVCASPVMAWPPSCEKLKIAVRRLRIIFHFGSPMKCGVLACASAPPAKINIMRGGQPRYGRLDGGGRVCRVSCHRRPMRCLGVASRQRASDVAYVGLPRSVVS